MLCYTPDVVDYPVSSLASPIVWMTCSCLPGSGLDFHSPASQDSVPLVTKAYLQANWDNGEPDLSRAGKYISISRDSVGRKGP